jgi:bifunctional DNase/RNase
VALAGIRPEGKSRMVEMKIKIIALEQETKNPVMFLTDLEDKHFLMIWIGGFEAQAIISEMDGVSVPRPMTHDLMKAVMEQLGGKVKRVVINDLQDQTFFARIVVEREGREMEIDARPSDSVALALRFKAPIFVTENVMLQAALPNSKKIEEDNRKFKEFIENLSADAFTVNGEVEQKIRDQIEREYKERTAGEAGKQPPATGKAKAEGEKSPPRSEGSEEGQ